MYKITRFAFTMHCTSLSVSTIFFDEQLLWTGGERRDLILLANFKLLDLLALRNQAQITLIFEVVIIGHWKLFF